MNNYATWCLGNLEFSPVNTNQQCPWEKSNVIMPHTRSAHGVHLYDRHIFRKFCIGDVCSSPIPFSYWIQFGQVTGPQTYKNGPWFAEEPAVFNCEQSTFETTAVCPPQAHNNSSFSFCAKKLIAWSAISFSSFSPRLWHAFSWRTLRYFCRRFFFWRVCSLHHFSVEVIINAVQ